MRIWSKVWCMIIFFAGGILPAFAQLSTLGNEFWVGFMDNNRVFPAGNNPGAPDFAVLVITADEPTTGAIEYLNNSIPFSLGAGQQFTLRVNSFDLDLLHRVSGLIERKGIHVTSTGKVAVHAFNERYRSADGTVVLPVGALGQDYYITSHYETMTVDAGYNANINNESTLLIIAIEDNTRVEITTSVGTLSGNTAGVPSLITLDRGQSYQIKAKADLTGSRVRVIGDDANDCKKIAVFGGNKWAPVGNCGQANDHLFQQAYPVNTWGTSFVHTALEGRSSGELVKVLASEDGTVVTVNGTNRGTINQAEWLPLEFAADESAKIETSKPASVTVFSKSMACNLPNSPEANNGDPFMITYSPVEQLLQNITFNAMDLPSIVNHYVNVVVKQGTENRTILDGTNVGNRFSPLPGDSDFSIARIPISRGSHRLSNQEGFTAYVYGFGEIESYGYAAGAALDNLNFQTENEYEFEIQGENVACLNQEALWDVKSDNPNFTYFVWDFGDGSDPRVGKEVNHTFTAPGKYEVVIQASLSPNTCEQQEEVRFEVEVYESLAEILGPTSVCPDVEQMIYKLGENQQVSQVDFEVEGGVILEDYGDSVLVNWGPANPNAKLRMIPYTSEGCPGAPIELPVEINNRIVVSAAEGPEDICFDPSVSIFYTAPDANTGRGYDWQIVGGTILSGQGESVVEVSWDQPGIVGELFYTAYSLVDNSCEGLAEAIEVNVGLELVAEIANASSIGCFGDSSGEISITVSGGTAPYRIEWDHDPLEDSFSITNLPEGTYAARVYDEKGCFRLLENIEITQPDALQVVSLDPQGVSCYGKPDGRVQLVIQGGVAPYQLEYNGLQEFDGVLTLDQLPQGQYDWLLTDSNGCQLPVAFEITSPVAVEVDVRLERPACPGGTNGELLALPRGGSGPYVYAWNELSLVQDRVDGLPAGDYSIQITDAEGCVSLGTGRVVEASPQIRMPTGFDPRQSPGIYQGVSNCEVDFELWIYNRWGQLIYQGNTGWDGTIEGEEAPLGSYSYVARYFYQLENKSEVTEKKGIFTLIR